MAETPLNLLNNEARSDWVHLKTLINLRWLAIVGQSAALMVAAFSLGLDLEVSLLVLAISVSIAFNVLFTIIFPKVRRLSERESLFGLMFDIFQLTFLLFLTGGLSNPFALLILAPVTISATALSLRSTIAVCLTAIVLISAIAVNHFPLRTLSGEVLEMPPLFVAGFWVSLIIGVVFLAGYARRVTIETRSMSQALLATQMALGREQKLTDLGGVVAATAHELGTPLATIKLVSSELIDDLPADSPHREDAALIREQADRCGDILRNMGRAGKDDTHMRHALISALVEEAAEPHESRDKKLHFSTRVRDGGTGNQPLIGRHPEIIHGLRNLIQNAVDFAAQNVWIDIGWNSQFIFITIADDGPGYPENLVPRIGDPFVKKRVHAPENPPRPGYEGMGLGLFIAKTLLERSGATLTFSNGADPFLRTDEVPRRCGAIVELAWPRSLLEQDAEVAKRPLGRNEAIKP